MPYFILCISFFILVASIFVSLSIAAYFSKNSRYSIRDLIIDEDKRIKWRIVAVFILVVIGIVIVIRYYFFANEKLEIINQTVDQKDKNDGGTNSSILTSYGVIGDFIGGFVGVIFNLVGIILLFETLSLQRREIKAGREAFQREEFENRFFKFIDYHRQNVAQLKFRDSDDKGEKYWEGNQVFTIIHYQVRNLLADYWNNRKKDITFDSNSLTNKREAINFVYQCVFFGSGEDGRKVLQKIFGDRMDNFKQVDFLERRAAYSKQLLIIGSTKYNRYYSGFVRGLGHYFRNIYQAIRYVEDQDESIFPAKRKYEYIAHFRAQMSVYEQLVFFYNSLSDLGDSWELEQYFKNTPTGKDERRMSFGKLLLTKYDLVRNTLYNDINGEIISGISMKDFYPLLNLEHEEECSVHGKLPYKDKDNIVKNEICRFCFNEKYIGYINENAEGKIIEYFTKEQYERDNADEKLFRCDEEDCNTSRSIRSKTKYTI